MGKRSEFERKPQDFYPTPRVAVERALDFLIADMNLHGGYIEPCVGDGALRNHIADLSGVHTCWYTMDIEKRFVGVNDVADASDVAAMIYAKRFSDLIITNPPWRWEVLSKLLDTWRTVGFTAWLLLSADWAHNKRAAPYMKRCSDIVPVGRLKWLPDSKHYSKDNNAWYRFAPDTVNVTQFHARMK